MADIKKLLDIMARLRDPVSGCPWDLQQDYRSIAPYTIEEACEVADAIERDALDELPDELGDLLFQVVFYAQMAREEGRFDFGDVVEAICEKMIRRHPHVFADAERGDAERQLQRWDEIKAAERAEQAGGSALDNVPMTLSALTRAAKTGKKAAKTGFDWPDVSGVFAKVREETDELAEATAQGEATAIADELGDLLFSVAQLARHLNIDPEQALRDSTRKFERRFRQMESTNDALIDLSPDSLERAWQRAKQESEPA